MAASRQPISRTCCARNRERGAVLPVVVFASLALVAFLAFTVDVMRTFQASRQMGFAAEAAALHAYSMMTNNDGTKPADPSNNIMLALNEPSGASGQAWNEAPLGPKSDSGPYRGPVSFAAEDVLLVPNPGDGTEQFLQVKAERKGEDRLKFFFLPAIFALNETLPQNSLTGSPVSRVEVIGQPATRIGAGPARGSANPREAALERFAAFPLAISNQQFLSAANSADGATIYSVDLPLSSNAASPVVANQMKGALALLYAPGGTDYYSQASGGQQMTETLNTLKYFWDAVDPGALAPGAVERGSKVPTVDPADPAFAARKADFINALKLVPLNRTYVIPVLKSDPIPGQKNEVAGFARVRFVRLVNIAGDDFQIQLALDESVPVRNASSTNGLASLPATGSMMPAPVAPFTPRSYLSDSNSLSSRLRGIALAPAMSPRTNLN